MTARHVVMTGAVVLVGLLAARAHADPEYFVDPADPVLHLDMLDPDTGRPAVLVPGAPWIRPGPDGLLGTEDDMITPEIRGDVDLVIRSGLFGAVEKMPTPAAAGGVLPVGVAEPFLQGIPIPFSVIPSDGRGEDPAGSPVVPPYLDGMPVLAVAFADLDRDGYVGVTLLDGNANDREIELAELTPVGRRYAIARNGLAIEQIGVTIGGPAAAPARIALTAAAFAGPFKEGYFQGVIPDGPAVMTHLPFLPETEPLSVIRQGLFGLKPADPAGRIAVQVRMAARPDPSHPLIGEAFTLRLDGSDPTIDAALVRSGVASHVGVVRAPASTGYVQLTARPLKPGLDEEGRPAIFEILSSLGIPDDGAGTPVRVRLVMLDRLDNITDPVEPTMLRLRTHGSVVIADPDLDDDPFEEHVLLEDARGVEVALDDLGGEYDDEDADRLVIHAHGRPTAITLVLADPDFDGDGEVNADDAEILGDCVGSRLGDPSFNPQLDLDGNGLVDSGDQAILQSRMGFEVLPDEARSDGKIKVRKWKSGKAHRPEDARDIKALREEEKRRKKELKEAWKKTKHRKRYCYFEAPK